MEFVPNKYTFFILSNLGLWLRPKERGFYFLYTLLFFVLAKNKVYILWQETLSVCFYFADPVETSLWAIWEYQHLQYLHLISSRSETNLLQHTVCFIIL